MAHWRLAAWYFIYFAFIGAYMPYFGVYLQAQGYSAWDISLLLSLMQLMRLVAPNLWSQLAERRGHLAPVVQATTALCILCYSLLFFSQGLLQTFFAMALLAFFWSAALPLVEALTLSQLDRHAERYGRIRLWGSIGFVVAVQGIGALLDARPIISLLWVSLALLVLLLSSTLALPETPSLHEPRPTTSYRAMLLRQPKLQPLLWACFLMSAAHGPLYVFYSIHLVDQAYPKTLIGALWSLGVIAEILAFMWIPRLLSRYRLRPLLLLTFVAAALRFLAIGWGASSIMLLVLAQLLHGLTFGAFHAVMVAILHRWFPGREQARAQALYGSISFGAGGLLGGLLSGQVWEIMGAGWTYTLGALFALGGGLIILRNLQTLDEAPHTTPHS
jgi:PPP family 3-phenylpropionic acid transporter